MAKEILDIVSSMSPCIVMKDDGVRCQQVSSLSPECWTKMIAQEIAVVGSVYCLSLRYSVVQYRSINIHSPAPRCGTIASVAFILWRVEQATNKLCWLASMCKYNMQGSYNYNHCSGQRGSKIDH
jgi:hypothetical protein